MNLDEFVTEHEGPKVGWKFSTWSVPPVPCSACGREVTAGEIRVDAPFPPDQCLCTDCHFKIVVLRTDPDPKAQRPEWAR